MRLLGITALSIAAIGITADQWPADAATVKTVVLKDIEFTPATVSIRRGGSVRWVWKDPRVSHDVTSRGRLRFRFSETKLTGTHTVRFRRSGTYRYVCTIHPNMFGKVVVR